FDGLIVVGTRRAECGGPGVLLRLPWTEARLDLLRKLRRVAGQFVRVVRDDSRGVVMLTAVVAGRRHAGDHVRTGGANHPHVVCGDLVAPPLLERLVDAEGVAEVDRAREILLGAVEPMQRGELFGAKDAESFEDLRSDFVLSAVSARGRDERRSEAL